ncbi:MAG: hypothetical protein ABSF73_04460 [Terriglobia bacterium]|jgi:hypothetical protein
MKSIRSLKSVRILLLAVLAAGLSASLASAQDYEGKFTLPFEARWGTAVLPAGDYSFRINTNNYSCIALVSQGGRGVAFIMPDTAASRGEVAGSSALIAVRSAGSYRIRALRLAEAGVVLEYNPPKAERQILAQQPVLFQRVPVIAAGK